MNRPKDSSVPPKLQGGAANPGSGRPATKRASSSPHKTYLIAYNFISAALWLAVLGRVGLVGLSHGYAKVFAATFDYVKIVQTLAVLEILHSALGIVRAPLLTTVMQVSSRLVLVWGIAHFFPQTTAPSLAYTTMLLAWSATEVVRYSFFAINLAFGSVPSWLTWLRYNTFFALYPLGIGSECWLVWRAIEPSKEFGIGLEWGLTAVLLIYVPGSYVLFTHMMTQRRKVMRSLKEKKR